MNKKIVYVAVVLLIVSGASFLAQIFAEAAGVNKKVTMVVSFVVLGLAGAVIGYLQENHRPEYDAAHEIVYTPYSKYGWYALFFALLFFAAIAIYLAYLAFS